MKKKICVLFGAGAESSFGLSDGGNFAMNVLGIKKENENIIAMNEAIKKRYKSIAQKNDWYSNYSQDPITLEELVKASVRKKYLSETTNLKSKLETDRNIKNDIKYLMNNEQERNNIIDKYTSYMGVLDEKFHTIISPITLGPDNFWKVINAYTRAYLLLSSEIIHPKKELITEDEYTHILEKPYDTMKKIKEFARSYRKKCYYSIIKKYKRSRNIKIITTNYTSLCKDICRVNNKNIAYIHGKFGLFEIPDKLQIINIKDDKIQRKFRNELYFPYIAIQSGVKPIIDSTQIKEYNKMLNFLDGSDILIIVGFALNIDDNHINCILRQYLFEKDIEIYFFDYENKLTSTILYQRLRLNQNDDNKLKGKLIHVKVRQNNAYKKFEQLLKYGSL